MVWNLKNNGSQAGERIKQLAAGRKKPIVAMGLIILMAVMWVRVLTKKTPESAEAALAVTKTVQQQSNSKKVQEITFIELPEVRGRNDVLTRDIFDAQGWKGFRAAGYSGGIGKSSIVSENDGEEAVKRVIEKLRLEGVLLSANPQAFINDKLVAVGDSVPIKDGINTYECEVIEIKENTVLVRYGQTMIKLKLTDSIGKTN